MFLSNIVRAINGLASALHDLASSNRQLAGAIREPEKASGEGEVGSKAWLLDLLRQTEAAEIINTGTEDETPQAKVLYASEYDDEKEKLREEMEEYWKTRGVGPVGVEMPQNIADNLAKLAKEAGFHDLREFLAHLEAENG